jgi:hypothetical protein
MQTTIYTDATGFDVLAEAWDELLGYWSVQ